MEHSMMAVEELEHSPHNDNDNHNDSNRCHESESESESTSMHSAAPIAKDKDKILVPVEVCLRSSSRARPEDIRIAVQRMLEKRSLTYSEGPLALPAEELFLMENVDSIYICDTDEKSDNHEVLLFWQLNEEGPGEEIGAEDSIASFQEWLLPAKEFKGLWESLIFDTSLKQRLLRYAESALLFSDKGVDPSLISWNRVILLHGPPGTGKTSLSKALSQKLSIRLSSRYSLFQLVEINAHSLFSKWFSESGKLVTRLFQKIYEMIEEENTLIFVLIDEVESLVAARQAALSRSEPSDSIRVVNALLTQLDRLKAFANVVVLTTSNITSAIDIAFVDRADIKAYIGPPMIQARYEILRSCLQELLRTGIIVPPMGFQGIQLVNFSCLQHCTNAAVLNDDEMSLNICNHLLEAATICEGFSGRALRKLPFLAHASLVHNSSFDVSRFISALIDTAKSELCEKVC